MCLPLPLPAGAWLAQFPGGHGFLWEADNMERAMRVMNTFLSADDKIAQGAAQGAGAGGGEGRAVGEEL